MLVYILEENENKKPRKVIMKIKKQSTKDRIIQAAWELFPEKGYEKTTLDDIIERSDTSRGAFYHHFPSKEDLLFCLAYYFDNDYSEWMSQLNTEMHTIDKLLHFDYYIMKNLEVSPYRPFLPALYGYQVMTSGQKYILDPDRIYYKLLNQLMRQGLEKGHIHTTKSVNDLTHEYANLQRSFTYNWCLENFRYSLVEFSHPIMKLYLEAMRGQA